MAKNQRKYKIFYGNRPYIRIYGRRWYFDQIDRVTGMNLTMFTNCGYYGGYKLSSIEYGIEDYAIMEKVEQ